MFTFTFQFLISIRFYVMAKTEIKRDSDDAFVKQTQGRFLSLPEFDNKIYIKIEKKYMFLLSETKREREKNHR